MSTFFMVLRMIMTLLPTIVEIVKKIEEMFPAPGAGPKKLALVIDTITDIYESSPDLSKSVPKETVIATVTKIVARIVALFNSLGIFKTAPTA